VLEMSGFFFMVNQVTAEPEALSYLKGE
jgi:hypothetical protein